MSGAPFSVSSGDVKAGAGGVRLANAMAEPDQTNIQFWQDVFDRAKGVGVQSHRTQLAQDGPSDGERAGHAPSAAEQAFALPAGDVAGEAPMPGQGATGASALLAHAGLVDSPTVLIAGGRVFQAWSERMAPGDTASPTTSKLASEPAANAQEKLAAASAEVESALKAHFMQTESGDWKVAVRAGKGLSAAQAMSAVAAALNQDGSPQGQVEQIVLNGACIYQQRSSAGGASPSTFELKC